MKRYINKITVGVAGVLVVYACVAIMTAFAWPWWPGQGDAPYHADYVYQLYNGGLPDWDEGIQYPAFKEMVESPNSKYEDGYKHIGSPHPPLFYTVQAPFMGPLLNAGEWEKAIAVGRIVNVVLGVIAGALMAWAAWLYGGRHRRKLAIIVPLFGLMINSFIYLSSRLVNDTMVVIFATLVMIVMYYIYKRGASMKMICAYGAVAALGMLSKATFITVLIPSYLLIVYLLYKDRIELGWRKLLTLLLIPVVIVSLASGWFYVRNLMQSGDFTRAGSQDWVQDRREPKDLKQVLTTSPFYSIFYKSITQPSLSVAITASMVVSLLYIAHRDSRRTGRFIKNNIPIIAFFVAVAGLTVVAQIKHAIPYGAYGTRYFLPILFPVAYLFAYALMRIPLLGGYWVVLVSLVMALATLGQYRLGGSGYYIGPDTIKGLEAAFVQNSIPGILLYIFFAIGAVGVFAIIRSLYMINKNK